MNDKDVELMERIFGELSDKIDDITESLKEEIPKYIPVVHRTNIENLPNIMSEGLKISKSVTPAGANEIIEISKVIKERLNIEEDRYKTIYALFNDEEIEDSYIDELESRKEALIEFKIDIDDDRVFVADFDPINNAIFNQLDYNRTKSELHLKEMKKNLLKYWNSFISIKEYIINNIKYEHEEILIFHDIEPYEITILYK